MRYLIVLLLLVSSFAHAGAPNCTNTRAITAGQSIALDDSDCILEVSVAGTSYTDFVRGYLPLPENSYTGQEFTIKDLSAGQHEEGYWYDEENLQWVFYSVDYTAGVGLEASYPAESSGDEVTSFSPGRYVKAVFDGAHWSLTSGNL